MRYLGGSLGLLIIPIVVNGILGCLRYPKEAEKGKVYLPRFFAILGVSVALLFLSLLIITSITREAVWVQITLLVFALFGVAFIIAFANCKIEYHVDGFTSKNFFGIKRKYTYDQVDAIKIDMHENYILIGKHKVIIDEFAVGGPDFITYVRKRYRTIHQGKALPVVKKSKRDIFNGNVLDAGGFLFIYVLMSIFLLASLVLFAYMIWFCPETAENTIEEKVTFEASTVDGENYLMISASGEIYEIRYWNERANRNAIEKACQNAEKLTVFSTEIKDETRTTQSWLVAEVRSENETLLSFDETNHLNQKNSAPIIWLPIGFGILWGLYIAGSIIVGRNPRKYRKYVKFFFKKGYVNFDWSAMTQL